MRAKWKVTILVGLASALVAFVYSYASFRFGALPVFAAVAPIIVASIALVSPLFTQFTEISKLRQAWINDLRVDIADFLGLADEWQIASRRRRTDRFLDRPATDVDGAFRKANVVLFRVRMRINPLPSNPDRLEDDRFLASLDDLMDQARHDEVGWKVLANRAVHEGALLLKREWTKLKKPAYQQMWESFVGDEVRQGPTPSSIRLIP